jgi:hypothetical protein
MTFAARIKSASGRSGIKKQDEKLFFIEVHSHDVCCIV